MSVYKSYTQEQLDNIASNYLISSWSYSKVGQFCRNEKGFEMQHIYGYKTKSAATTIAGQAYHYVLQWFFQKLKDGEELLLADAHTIGYNYIDEVEANKWKIQKTVPTVEDCILKSNKNTVSLVDNFYKEQKSYTEEIEEVLHVEIYFSEYLTLNGVDIPIKGNGVIDLVVRLKDQRIIIIDHKSKDKYTPEDEIKFTSGKQAVTYYKALLSKFGLKADEVWIAENKVAKNKDGSPQIQITKIKLDDDVVRLYEALLYEPLRRMLEAVSNPDYVYVINDSDSLIDKAEIYDFWVKTMIAEVDDFNIEEDKKPLIEKRLKKIRDASLASVNPSAIREFRKNAREFIQYDLSNTDMTPQQKIEHVLRHKNIMVNVAHTFNGYSSNSYLLEFEASVNISSIFKHKLDIASALDVSSVRISNTLKMHEGKSYLALDHSIKREKNLLWDASELVGMKIPLGKDNMGNTIYWDLENQSTANKFTQGSVGSGKSASIISDLEYVLLMENITKIVILDPKYEFTKYSSVDKISVYNEIEDIEDAMKELVLEMDAKIKAGNKEYVFVILDEYADILSNSRKGKELDIMENVQDGFYATKKGEMFARPKMKLKKVGQEASFEENFMKLSQKGRSSGFRINAATQISTSDILTTKIKVNYPVMVSFRVPKESNSRVALDEGGAEGLSGMGDGLIKSTDYPEVVRFQAFYKP